MAELVVEQRVEEWFAGDRYETLTICRTLEPARAVFATAVAEKLGGRFMIALAW